MSAIIELKDALEQLQTAHFVTTMLRDISATRLHSIRTAFEANEKYYTELHELMALVQRYAQNNNSHTVWDTTPARVYIALTSNKRFYGTLNHEVMRLYEAQRQEHPEAAGVIIGQTGQTIHELQAEASLSTYELYEHDEPAVAEMVSSIKKVAGYTEVIMIHPTFINSFTQKAAITDISHVPAAQNTETLVPVEYLLEPDIAEMITFFTTQIRLVLFERVLLETRLALTGARLMKMQRARERAGELVKEQRLIIHKETSTVKSMRLLETFTGFQKKDL
ncbi:F0F1 ATP synthase subunit gamma [Patescibacteria group bacterium]|nr:F0F1 ATP synthase subunit gamma [Patescibacteria group bacterium]